MAKPAVSRTFAGRLLVCEAACPLRSPMTFVFEAAFLLSFVFTGTSASDKKNVKGGDLQLCSSSGMAMTGFTRDGYCTECAGSLTTVGVA